jgi:molybdenum-dependent DNA-binding transcriptional regulator ModE
MKVEARLRAFAAFARKRSFSSAAEELGISQPAVSKHVADLEQELGIKLVERSRRDGALTQAGDSSRTTSFGPSLSWRRQVSVPLNFAKAARVRSRS